MAQIFALHGAATSLVIAAQDHGPPVWRYWGPRLADGTTPPPLARPATTFAVDCTTPYTLFPTFGCGWFGASALLAHRDGQDFAQAFDKAKIEWTEAGRSLAVTLTDSVARLEVSLAIALDLASDVLTMATTLTNRGDSDLEVLWLAAACLPLTPDADRLRTTSGRHNREFVPVEVAPSGGQWRRDNRQGLTSHDAFPGAIIAPPGTTQNHGLAFGAQLAWSGNHSQLVEAIDDGRSQWQLGEWLAPGEVRLTPGASLTSPEVLATCSIQGFGGVARNFHAAIRARSSWPGGAMRPRPVHLNTWEALYFAHDIAALKALADAAAEVGVERFVLDDGWFKGRSDDRRALGDWMADPVKYPAGLGDLIGHVTALGMEFGLWVEPEMVNPDSDLFRAHPDWALAIEGRPVVTARNQLVLDLSRQGVADHLFAVLDALLQAHPIAYLKWDHNRALTHAAGPDGRPRYRQQVLAAYALIDRLLAAHPALEIEACAAGGGRIDVGIATRTHRFWTSDNIDAVSRVPMQRGFLQFMPPERMGAHVGASPAHATGRRQSLAFRAAVAIPGHFGVELDLRTLDTTACADLAHWIALYKAHRGRLHHGPVWWGEGSDGLLWQAHGDASGLLLFVYRLDPPTQAYPSPIALPMLPPDRAYAIDRIDRPAPAIADIPGSWLAAVGLDVAPLRAEQAAVYAIEAR